MYITFCEHFFVFGAKCAVGMMSDASDAVGWSRAHVDALVFACVAYVVFVVYAPVMIVRPFRVRALWFAWNVGLAAFSFVGACKTLSFLAHTLITEGFGYTVCGVSGAWYLDDATGLWVTLFVLSKPMELFDTVFLAFQKKPITFLHWYHHLTVMIYCWHALATSSTTGLWFCSINYFVHAMMYSYYAVGLVGWPFDRRVMRRIAPWITFFQIAQMFCGLFVTLASGARHDAQCRTCDTFCADTLPV